MTGDLLDFYLLDFLGVAVFAISGVLAAGRKHLDIFGAWVIAMVTSIGGGTLRDLLLDRHPVFWIKSPIYLYVILISTIITILYTRIGKPPFRLLLIADALGLAFFTIAGTQIAERQYSASIIVVIMGVITGVAGGLIRDVLLIEIPAILRRTKIYATPAILGAVLYVLLKQAGLNSLAAALPSIAMIATLRLAAIVWGITLPEFVLSEEDTEPPEV